MHADIGQQDITVLYLVLGGAVNFHVVAVFDEIAFAKDSAYDSKPLAREDALICEFNSNVPAHGVLQDCIFC